MSFIEPIKKIFRPTYRSVKCSLNFMMWAISGLFNQLFFHIKNKKRILIIYDTSSQPFSIGDVLLFQEASLVLRKEINADFIDFAIICDHKNPTTSDLAFKNITEENISYHLASILSVAQVNPYLGSLFVFNSLSHIERFVADNIDRYYIWPSGSKFATKEYLHNRIFNELLFKHYKKHDSIPELSCRPFLIEWSKSFYREHVFPNIPITVNIRNNKEFHTHRNLRIDRWINFFKHCEKRYPATFVVICAVKEIDDRLRQCRNVIISKDYHTGIEQDLTLIHTSAFHMGADSGPTIMAIFNKKPYVIFNAAVESHHYFPSVFQKYLNGFKWWFASPMQKYLKGVETTTLLISEFENMWKFLDQNEWKLSYKKKTKSFDKFHNWLR
jgi:hypothetical protein